MDMLFNRLRGTVALFVLTAALFAPAASARATTPEDSTIAVPPVSPVQRLIDRSSVVGSKGHARAIPGSAQFLGPDVLPNQDQSFGDVRPLMLRIPGVYAIGEDGYGLRPNLGMRGLDPYRSAGLTIMEDGVLISPAPYAAPGLPVFAGLGRMESVETLKGSSQIPYGPRTSGGVVNFATLAVPNDLVGTAQLSLGGYDAQTLNLNYGDSWKNASWMLATNQTRTDGFKALDGGGETGFEQEDYLVKLNFTSALDADHYQDVLFKAGYFQTDAHDSYLGLTDADFDATPYRRYSASQQDQMKHDATQLLLRHFIALSDALDITTSLYQNSVDLNWYLLDSVDGISPDDVLEDPSLYDQEYEILTGDSTSADNALQVKSNQHSYFSTGIQSALGAAFTTGAARHELETGLRYHKDEEDRLNRNDGYRMVSRGAMVLTSRGPDGGAGGADNQINEAQSFAGYVRDRISGGKWSVTPGVRVEYVETTESTYGPADPGRTTATVVVENSTTAVLPGIGLTYRASSSVLVLGGIHEGFTPPTPAGGGDGVKSTQYEAGARARHGTIDAALIGFLTDSGLASDGPNVARTSGVEVSAAYAIRDPAYGIDLSAAYTFTSATYAEPTTFLDTVWPGVVNGDVIPYVPEHAVSASAVLTTKKSYLGIFASYMSRMRTVPGTGDFSDTVSADGRVLVDIITEFEVVRHVRVFASVYNVGDEVYVASRFPYGAHPGAPLTATAGLKLSL